MRHIVQPFSDRIIEESLLKNPPRAYLVLRRLSGEEHWIDNSYSYAGRWVHGHECIAPANVHLNIKFVVRNHLSTEKASTAVSMVLGIGLHH